MMTPSAPALVETAVLMLVPAWSLLRLPGRSLARMFPAVWAALLAALFLWCALVSFLAVRWPAALHLLAVLTAVAAALAIVVSRAGFGRRRGLPPGRLSIAGAFDALVDRDYYRREAARFGPIFKMAQFHRPVICILGLARGHELLRKHERALTPSILRFNREIPLGALRYMDPQTHARYSPLFRQALAASIIAASEPVVIEAAKEELAAAARSGDGADISPERLLERITTRSFLHALFGLREGTPEFEALSGPLATLARRRVTDRPTRAFRRAVAELRVRLTALLENRRTRADAPVCALTELARLDPRMPDATCLDNLLLMHRVASSDVLGLLRWTLAMLGTHPEWQARVAREAEAETDSDGRDATLVERVIMETLRLSQSEYLYRRLDRDVRFESFLLPRGWLVRICVWESHRSHEVFADANLFNPDRFLAQEYGRAAYLPFGGDRHACNGVPLTNLICQTVVRELSRGYRWSVRGVEPLDRDFRHWSHWRPGRGLRLRLKPLTSGPLPSSTSSQFRSAAAAG